MKLFGVESEFFGTGIYVVVAEDSERALSLAKRQAMKKSQVSDYESTTEVFRNYLDSLAAKEITTDLDAEFVSAELWES